MHVKIVKNEVITIDMIGKTYEEMSSIHIYLNSLLLTKETVITTSGLSDHILYVLCGSLSFINYILITDSESVKQYVKKTELQESDCETLLEKILNNSEFISLAW